MFDRA